jgi:hypothetical protein
VGAFHDDIIIKIIGQVHTVIENLLHHYIQKISKLEIEDFMPKVSEIISKEMFALILEKSQALFL